MEKYRCISDWQLYFGGVFMGYGACISFGANIGTFFSGIASIVVGHY
ncbi:YeeE/YedE thiosulfate transporter family protein [Alteribacillus sp. JSM 102045]